MEETCQKCSRPLAPGELRYQCTIDLRSMWDGYIDEPKGGPDEEIESLLEILSRQSPQEMMDDVALTISLVICRDCRNRLVKDYRPKGVTVH